MSGPSLVADNHSIQEVLDLSYPIVNASNLLQIVLKLCTLGSKATNILLVQSGLVRIGIK